MHLLLCRKKHLLLRSSTARHLLFKTDYEPVLIHVLCLVISYFDDNKLNIVAK